MTNTLDTTSLFSSEEWLRYTRHIQLPQVGVAGQLKLKNSHVLVIGAGGLGSPASLYLAAAGVGQITLVDHDSVDITNLQRQILFDTRAIGKSKVEEAQNRLTHLNPHIKINIDDQPFTEHNAANHVEKADIVLDCTDNVSTRYLINDTCTLLAKPWVYASIHQFSGQCSLFTPETGCFRCLFPEYPTNLADCNTGGVLGTLPGLLGTLQVNEAIKFLCNLTTPLAGNLLLVDALDLSFQKIQLNKNVACCACSLQQPDRDFYHEPLCNTETHSSVISASDFIGRSHSGKILAIDVRTEIEHAGFSLEGLFIPLNSIEGRLTEIPKNKTIVCYCQSGTRSLKAVELLSKHGIDALSVAGGLTEILRSKNAKPKSSKD